MSTSSTKSTSSSSPKRISAFQAVQLIQEVLISISYFSTNGSFGHFVSFIEDEITQTWQKEWISNIKSVVKPDLFVIDYFKISYQFDI